MVKQRRKLLIGLVVASFAIAYLYHQSLPKAPTSRPSNYSIYSRVEPDYRVTVEENNLNYRPVGLWTGRLILPSSYELDNGSYVYLELHNTPAKYRNLVGKKVKLSWQNTASVKEYLKSTTKDVRFNSVALDSQISGNLHPVRLNNKSHVNPLQSLAGARSKDDVLVKLEEPTIVSEEQQGYSLQINSEPIQISGREYGLISILSSPNKSNRDVFLVRHFNSQTQSFTGKKELINIPKSVPDRDGIYRFNNEEIENSWYNFSGWYIYGLRDSQGNFVVTSIFPRQILQLQPNGIRLGRAAAKSYIDSQMWHQTPLKKGTAQTTLLDSKADSAIEAISNWQEGDRAILMHLYGGIGGKKAESTTYGIVTGHFAYGIAKIVREPISDRLIIEPTYYQIYAHNPDGIVAGKMDAASYLGDIQRGWLGNRPIADVAIKFPPVTQDYDFDGIKLSPLDEFSAELQKMMARYRIGDGTGTATVSPVTSCVQDANQALYITIKKVTRKVQTNPQIQAWLNANPNHPQTQRFNQLVKLGEDLEKNLVPLGIVRPDWQQSVEQLAGIKQPDSLFDTVFKGVLSWRTILPRRAHDEITTIFLNNGASVWVMRTNQLGGFDPDIAPLAPTALFRHNS